MLLALLPRPYGIGYTKNNTGTAFAVHFRHFVDTPALQVVTNF